MLRHLGEQAAAERVETAVREVIAEGDAHDLRPRRQRRAPRAFADAIIERLGATAGAAVLTAPDAGEREAEAQMLLRYRGSEGMLAWAFHRISGVAIWVFILLHVFDIWLVGGEPDAVRRRPEVYASPSGGSARCSSARRSCTTR